MNLPKPEEMRGQIAAMNERLAAGVNRLCQMGENFGVDGEPTNLNGSVFKLFRHCEKWSVYLMGFDTITLVTDTPLEEKLDFLENVKQFEDAYLKQVAVVFGRLRKLPTDK